MNNTLKVDTVSTQFTSMLCYMTLFYYAENFNNDISTWDISSVVDMSYMFYYANNFNKSLSAWDVSSVIDMSYMFAYANQFSGYPMCHSRSQTGMF